MTWLLFIASALAFPYRSPPPRDPVVQHEPGRLEHVLVVKLAEGQGLTFSASGELVGPGDLDELRSLLEGSRPLFQRDPEQIIADRKAVDPRQELADLTLYRRIVDVDVENRAALLMADQRVETAYLAFAPVKPPADLDPVTPDFTGEQTYMGAGPDGFGFTEVQGWPGVRGDNVTIADVEYSYRPSHEDLEALLTATTTGYDSGAYEFHGNAVLGQLFAGDNGYGVVGMVPNAAPHVAFPYVSPSEYNVAAAIDEAAARLGPGDVILIEQQSFAEGTYVPVEIDPAVWDAIALATAKGIVVVQPGGNGAADLDAKVWEGWFDRTQRDNGSIMVGGGASPKITGTPRVWSGGSSHGSRVDVQGWYDSIATTSTLMGDLFYPNDDLDQAYTAVFSGTSGASPMVTAAVAAFQSVAIEVQGAPWDPWDVRAALVSTGNPQPVDDAEAHPIGPQPDLRRLLRTWMLR